MKTRNRLSHYLLKLIYITLIPVLAAQKLEVRSEVTGHEGTDVTLHCLINPQPKSCKITQINWYLLQPDAKPTLIFVFHPFLGNVNREPRLQGRLEYENQSLVIKRVEMADAGSYRCTLVGFPCGKYDEVTKLVVHETKPSSAGHVVAIVTAVLLLFVILAAVVYFIYSRRREAAVRLQALIDTSGPVAAATRPSVIVKEKEVIYSDIMPKNPADASPHRNKDGDSAQADDVTYAEVVVLHQKPK